MAESRHPFIRYRWDTSMVRLPGGAGYPSNCAWWDRDGVLYVDDGLRVRALECEVESDTPDTVELRTADGVVVISPVEVEDIDTHLLVGLDGCRDRAEIYERIGVLDRQPEPREDGKAYPTPPIAVARQAELGLQLRGEFGRGGTSVGVARARDLMNRRPVSPDVIQRMVSFFRRHGAQVDRRAKGWEDRNDPSAQWIAWLLWGGDPGWEWAERWKAQFE